MFVLLFSFSGGYLCSCQPGYDGFNCENEINECELYQPCFSNGTKSCSDNVNNYTCNCMDGYTGKMIIVGQCIYFYLPLFHSFPAF